MSDTQTRIRDLVTSNQVVLFMKGTTDFPQCGFSMRAVNIVRALGVPFQTVNVLDDSEVRQGIKEFANWPTIPQLYINGEFVGGSDIMTQLWEQGELESLLTKDPEA
jgi:monothiol glutaredoxin